MDIEQIRIHCISKPGVTEGFPFDNDTLVFKVMGKIFVLLPLESGDRLNLKCDPTYAIELRDKYPEAVKPGYHMNKKHWNTVSIVDYLPDKLILHLINHSYEKVVSKLKKSEKEELRRMTSEE